jgi:hypothetical protein
MGWVPVGRAASVTFGERGRQRVDLCGEGIEFIGGGRGGFEFSRESSERLGNIASRFLGWSDCT